MKINRDTCVLLFFGVKFLTGGDYSTCYEFVVTSTMITADGELGALRIFKVNKSCFHANETAYNGGIPQNLAFNIIIWLLRKYFDYLF